MQTLSIMHSAYIFNLLKITVERAFHDVKPTFLLPHKFDYKFCMQQIVIYFVWINSQ